MDLVTVYKENETVEAYETIYFDDAKYKKNPPELGYRVLHIIGNGVYGVVYKVECLDDRKIVAMKQTYQKNANIFKEIEIMKKLKHPNIVELKHAFYTITSNGVNVHMVMEYANIDLSVALYYISLNSENNTVQYCINNSIGTNESSKKRDEEKTQGTSRNEKHAENVGEVKGVEENLQDSDEKEKKTKENEKETAAEEAAEEGEEEEEEEEKEKEKEEENRNNGEKKDGKKMLSNSGESKGGKKKKNEKEGHGNANTCVEYQKCTDGSSNKIYINDLNRSMNNICPFHDLDEYIRKNYFNQNQIKIYIYQLIRATLYLHSLNITHRDIKPQNILIFQNDIYSDDSNSASADNNECLVCVQNAFEKNIILYSRNKNRRNSGDPNGECREEKVEESDKCKGNERAESDVKEVDGVVQMATKGCSDNVPNGGHNTNNIDLSNVTKLDNNDCSDKETNSNRIVTNTNITTKKELQKNFSTGIIKNDDDDDTIMNVPKKENYTIEKTNVSCQYDNTKVKIGANEKEENSNSNEKAISSYVEETPKRKACRGNITFKYIKLCDFNTSIKLKENFKYFSYICSRYYRAPELLFGSNYYTQAIDTWSIGCVMGELILGKPLFLGECASDQLVEIIKVLGTPNDEDFLSFRSMYKDIKFPDIKPITLKKLISQNCSKDSIDLLGKLLQFNPKKRIKLYHALLHNYFDDIRSLKAFEIFDKTNNSDDKYSYSLNTNCFNFTKEELLHYTVEERKILIPSEVREKKIDEVKQYINMSIEHFDTLYPNSLYVS